MGDKEKFDFPTWNYGSTLGLQGQGGGYTEFKDERSYNTIEGYGFCGPRSEGGFGGGSGPRAPLPNQTECMPPAVQQQVEMEQAIIDNAPGVLIKNEDGSLVKVTDPNAPEPIPVTSEPTRFDKSVHGILNGRNAAMFVNLEAKKRGWEIEFEEVESGGPVHDRTYSYTLAIGPDLVTAGIAKSKKEAKRRCCEAMVLKIDDLPPAPPLHLQPHMRGRFPFPGRFPRGGRMPFGFPGQRMPFFRPRLPPPESEETIFKKYDKTPKDPHPSHNHPISKLCEKAKQHGWPQPVWDLVTEKVVDTKKHKHGRHNTMLYTFKVTVYPGKGQVEPKVYFGSGPTKKDAKFACGSVAWADIGSDDVVQGKPSVGQPVEVVVPATPDDLLPIPGASAEDPAQEAVNRAAEMNKPKKRAGEKISENKWLDIVAKSAEKEKDLKLEIDKERELKRKLHEEIEAKRKQQLAEEKLKRDVKEEKRSRSRDRSRRRSRSREEKRRRSRSRDKRSSHRDKDERRSGHRDRHDRVSSHRDRDDRGSSHRDRDSRGFDHRGKSSSGYRDRDDRDSSVKYRDDVDSGYRERGSRGDRGSSYRDRDDRGSSYRDRDHREYSRK